MSPAHMAAHLTRNDVDTSSLADDPDDWDGGPSSTVYRLHPHIRLLSGKFRDAAFGINKRQIWALPPRYGKSWLASKWGPAWFLELFPYKRVILASYGHDLALHNARECRNIMRSYRRMLTTQLMRDANAADQWNTSQGGGLKAAGVGGALTGFGADLAIVDDPLKDWEEAQSDNQREKVWAWYRAVLRTRLHKGGAIIVLATRWHLDDLSGRLLAEDAQRVREGKPPIWDYIRLPTIADGEDRGIPDALGREDGEVLCEALFPAHEVMEQREELGSLIFGAMHQQDPTESEGNIIKREWLQRYDAPPEPQELQEWAISVDATFGDSKNADYVVMQVWARGPFGHYLIDQRRGRWNYGDFKDQLLALWAQHPKVQSIHMEAKANGPAIVAELSHHIPGLVAYNPLGSKESRAHSVTHMMRTGHVWIPSNVLVPWGDALIEELCAFPNGVHDDQVDALVQYLLNVHHGPLSLGRSSYPFTARVR